jgi:hypothetical protein
MADCQDMVNKSGAEMLVIVACDYLYVYRCLFHSSRLSLLSTKLKVARKNEAPKPWKVPVAQMVAGEWY